ncbi:hypothetical protein CDAR_248202 [Caerostris darwini]|nr:hypothetical protein CDAR_248202 [Caerostris darwini]
MSESQRSLCPCEKKPVAIRAPPQKQTSADRMMAGCMNLKAKIEYWQNRNKELIQLATTERSEVATLVEKSKETVKIRMEYPIVENELRTRQSEKLDMRCRLEALRSRNGHLAEELELLRDDADKIRAKLADDDMLLEALTSQHGSFQDLIDRQKVAGDCDNRKFRSDLRGVHVKYTTGVVMLKQLEDLTVEKDGLLERLQDSMALASYVKDEPDEQKSMTSETPTLPESDKTE